MKKTPTGTSVGVADPYAHAGVCDHVTGDGKCRYAFDFPGNDSAFTEARAADDYRCPAATEAWAWRDCPHYRSKSDAHECARCGLEERRNAHTDDRPLLEEHHLAYAGERSEPAEQASDDEGAASHAGERREPAEQASDDAGTASHAEPTEGRVRGTSEGGEKRPASHEITVTLCRWCHAAVHDSWARIDDDVSPSPEAIATAEGRRSEELAEIGFRSAAERRGGDDSREES